ncbi:MAG: Glutamate-semialdehyde -aminomutase [Pseudomonadota bacterium]
MEIASTPAAAVVVAALCVAAHRVWRRWELSRAKHRSLAGHSFWAKTLARWIPGYAYNEATFFKVDGAPDTVAQLRREAFFSLGRTLEALAPQTLQSTERAKEGLADLQFTSRYRVPFQFSPLVQAHLKVGAFWTGSSGVTLRDCDGNVFYDLTGSYGVNVFGLDFYKACMDTAHAHAKDFGPILGSYHPCVVANIARLRAISGLEQVSFHMSGTEAVMQAVRLARYHTGKKRVVRFAGAYHGWWEDVQPGPGNPMPPRETYTLADMSERSLQVLRTRKDVACVLVNPLQGLHPNSNAPGDSTLVHGRTVAGFDRTRYGEWLRQLRDVCQKNGIVFILDEVFMGFRLGKRGAQAYFHVDADMVVYGKTLGGGLPVGVVCGKAALMQRFKPDRPADLCFARGTFNAHPNVMTSMDAFLTALDSEAVTELYGSLDATWAQREQAFNAALATADVPVRVRALSSVWSVTYTLPSRYHWMLQYYLRAEGLALSWVGTGRLIFSLNYTDDDMRVVTERFVRACQRMQADGWWWTSPERDARTLARGVLLEMLRVKAGL